MNAATAPERAASPGFSRTVIAESRLAREKWTYTQASQICRNLEAGHVVFLPTTPIEIPAANRELLLGWKQSSSLYHKNIAYRPLEDRVTGLQKGEARQAENLRRILREYSQRSVEFLKTFLLPYAGKWKLEFASFRPIEERGRTARLHARNDLLHFDSFPTRPTNGARILRFFTNINPTQNRVWLTSQTFEAFGPLMVKRAGLPSSLDHPLLRGINSLARALHLRSRSPYDDLMLRCHNVMKEDANFQETTPKTRREFPPNSSWMLFTDCVSHAVLSGQYALEQTLLVPQAALLDPQRSPLAILESLTGRQLTV
ncbi:MAG TPA: Kdo hydroxylase family protein [Candidatus Sulfotelmatobacter sp.]|nr:Kdo hydroxylase family protein [Candidatus Sulfotelmatobacter sp.]